MPICATGPLFRPLFAIAFVSAAASCGDSDSLTQAQREKMQLTSGRGAPSDADQPAKPRENDTARAEAQATPAPSDVSPRNAAAPMGAPAGTGAVPLGPPLPVAGSFGGAGMIAVITPVDPQRVPIRDAATIGTGVCGATTTDQFIAMAQQLRPELSEIRQLSHVDSGPGASSISAYLEPDGTFSLVFRRGDGDCFAGCVDNEYWYVKADDKCAPQQVGYYKRTNNPNANCFDESGLAMWDEPRALDPQFACGANLMPQNVAGSHELHARGVLQGCARSGETIAPMSIDKVIKLDVEQDAAELAKATITLLDVGHPLLDGRKLNAEVVRRRVVVHAQESNLPNKCIKQSQVDLEYDFEGLGGRSLYLMEVDTPDCSNKPDDYCKGYIELSLTEP